MAMTGICSGSCGRVAERRRDQKLTKESLGTLEGLGGGGFDVLTGAMEQTV